MSQLKLVVGGEESAAQRRDAPSRRFPRSALARLAATLRGCHPTSSDDPAAPIRSLVDPRDIYLG